LARNWPELNKKEVIMLWESIEKKILKDLKPFCPLPQINKSITGAFLGLPFGREVVKGTNEPFDPSRHENSELKVMLNFYVKDEGKMKVLDLCPVLFKQLIKARDENGLDNWFYSIHCKETNDASSFYWHLEKGERIDLAHLERIRSKTLWDLAEVATWYHPLW
jgi:hypothetical protein